MVEMNNYNFLKRLKIFYESIEELLNSEKMNLDDNFFGILDNTKNTISKLYEKTYKIIKNNNENSLETKEDCPQCSEKLKISDLIDYDYVCEDCDENFYSFEVDSNYIWYEEKGGIEI